MQLYALLSLLIASEEREEAIGKVLLVQ